MSDDPLSAFSGTVRLFPLPELVLFPHVVQPLHIFEPRYRDMTADALTGDGLIALVQLRPDALASDPPGIAPVCCIGRVVWHEKLTDGRYNLHLQGAARARIVEEVPSDALYRTARVELMPDEESDDVPLLGRLRGALAEAALPHFVEGSPARDQVRELFDSELTLGALCDVLSYALPLPPALKQALLEEPRVQYRCAQLATALGIRAARAARPFPPPFSAN